MTELHQECRIAGIYHLPNGRVSPSLSPSDPNQASRLIPQMLRDMQTQQQLAAGMTTYHGRRNQLIDTHKEVGSVADVFYLNDDSEYEKLMVKYTGPAAIGHVCCGTGGAGDRRDAQPLERHHIDKSKWFGIAFNGQLANYRELREELLSIPEVHLARGTDTEIVMHTICREMTGGKKPRLVEVVSALAQRFYGSYNIGFLNAVGDMFFVRDPLGRRPLCYAVEGSLFAAASESTALANLGYRRESIQSLEPGHPVIIENGVLTV